jgi:hypothetical protein
VSAWMHARSVFIELRPLEEALLNDLFYVSGSQYGAQLVPWLAEYDRSQVLVVRTEDLRTNPQTTVATVCAFIGADPDWTPDLARHNAGEDRRMPRWLTGRAVRSLTRTDPRRRLVRPTRRLPFAQHLVDRLWRAQETPLYRRFGPADSAVSPDLRARLVEYLAGDVRLLTELVGPEFVPWPGYGVSAQPRES